MAKPEIVVLWACDGKHVESARFVCKEKIFVVEDGRTGLAFHFRKRVKAMELGVMLDVDYTAFTGGRVIDITAADAKRKWADAAEHLAGLRDKRTAELREQIAKMRSHA